MRVVKLNKFKIATALKPSHSPITLPFSDEVQPPSYQRIETLQKQVNQLQNKILKEEKRSFSLLSYVKKLEAEKKREPNTALT